MVVTTYCCAVLETFFSGGLMLGQESIRTVVGEAKHLQSSLDVVYFSSQFSDLWTRKISNSPPPDENI